MIDDMKPGDIKKGILDDGWFLGALLIVATRPELFKNILVSNESDSFKYGFFYF